MTTHHTPEDQGRVFVSAKDARRTPKPERTDEQIRAEMKESVQRNAATLRTLSKL